MSCGVDQAAVFVDPCEDGSQRRGGESIAIFAVNAAGRDQLRRPQFEQVLRNGGLRDRKCGRQFLHGMLGIRKEIEDGAARRIRDRTVHLVARFRYNHSLMVSGISGVCK